MSAVDLVHKAEPGKDEGHCGRCGQPIKRVPDGTGFGTWIHSDRGTVAAPNPPVRTWAYGLTADEWFHLASEGQGSEVAPCCGNIGAIRDYLRELLAFQSEDDIGWRRSIGKELLRNLEADGDGHGLQDRDQFPLLHKVIDGVRAELEDPRI